MSTTTRQFGVWEMQVTGPVHVLHELGAPAVTVEGFCETPLDRSNLEVKASDAVAKLAGVAYDDFPERWCPLEFAEPVLSANQFRNPDGSQQWFVAVYEAGRAYGGPEEGGWWFDTGVLVQQTAVESFEAAEALRERYRVEFPAMNDPAEDFAIRIGIVPLPGFFPETMPVYE